MSRDTFHDLHVEKPVDSDHIRLISEGGSSPVKSPRPVCIDSIQVSQTCTTESHHATYRSATGACAIFSGADNLLFSVPAEHAQELDQCRLPAVLQNRLSQHGIAVSEGAKVFAEVKGKIWYVIDHERRFCVRKVAAHLTVFRET